MATIRHEFYETDDFVTVSIFDRGADPEKVSVAFDPRKVTYSHGEKTLVLDPLKGQINPDKSTFSVGKVKVELRLNKVAAFRWGGLIGEPDPLSSLPRPEASAPVARKPKKNWEGLSDEILNKEKDKTTEEDPNAGGDGAVNGFFQKIFADADDDTKRAMMKSYSESGGTTLSTNWDEIGKKRTEVKPPAGSEWKSWEGKTTARGDSS